MKFAFAKRKHAQLFKGSFVFPGVLHFRVWIAVPGGFFGGFESEPEIAIVGFCECVREKGANLLEFLASEEEHQAVEEEEGLEFLRKRVKKKRTSTEAY